MAQHHFLHMSQVFSHIKNIKTRLSINGECAINRCDAPDTHLYGHIAQLRRPTGVVVAALGGQQPVIRPEGEEDEHGRQRPKDPGEEQRHAQLHGPRPARRFCHWVA